MLAVLTSTIIIGIEAIQEEARRLVYSGKLGRQKPIYTLCHFFPAREWEAVELELEAHGYLLRDRVTDLLGHETWDED
jgi:hypothetical protein